MLAFLNVLSEIIECYVFIYLGGTFNVLRRGVQNCYIGTILAAIYAITVYLYSKVTIRRTVSAKISAILAIPMILGFISIIFGKTSYGRTPRGFYYNYGPLTDMCYYLGFLQLFAMFVGILIYRNRLKKEEFGALIFGTMVWIGLALHQFLVKGTQVSSVAMMIMALVVYLNIENPKELFEKSIPNVKNKDAFTMLLLEKYGVGKSFYIMSVIFTGKTSIQTAADREALYRLQANVADVIYMRLDLEAYLSNWNTLSFIDVSPEKVEDFMNNPLKAFM